MIKENSYYNFSIDSDITYLKGVGPRRAKKLKQHKIENICDLLEFYPRKYIDKTIITPINLVKVGTEALVVGKIKTCGFRRTKKRSFYQVSLFDDKGSINLVWFNALSWITEKFCKGNIVAAYGRVEFYNGYNIMHPDFDIIDNNDDPVHTGKIIGLYPGSSELKSVGLESRTFRKIINTAINKFSNDIRDYYSIDFINKYGLYNRKKAIINIHQPEDQISLKNAEYRLKFDEHFFLQTLMALRKKNFKDNNGRVFDKRGQYLKLLYDLIPFELTQSQIRVLKEIVNGKHSNFNLFRW